MTKEEILVMNPSVQLGNLVATEVMKWHREGDHWVAPEGFWIKAEGLDGWYPWRDISAAWQVVEKMQENKEPYYYLELRYSRILHCWMALFEYGSDQHEEIEGKTAPEAICKAALLAKCS